METFAAKEGPAAAKIAAWNEQYSARIERAEFAPLDPRQFAAEFHVGDLGPLRIARIRCSRGSIDRDARHIGHAAGRSYSIVVQLRGRGTFLHYGHQTIMTAGDFTLCDSAAPHSYALDDESEIVILRLAAGLLREHLPSPEYFCGRHLPAGVGLTATAATMANNLCNLVEAGLPGDYPARVARNLLDILATSYAIAFDTVLSGSSILSGRHAKVKLCIEQHLRNPELSPAWLAQQLKVSPRYLRMIFATSNETVSAYILRRRIEECARQMADPRWRGHSITEIAFGWGFNSASHFTRSFRDRHQQSPREYRRARLAAADACPRRVVDASVAAELALAS